MEPFGIQADLVFGPLVENIVDHQQDVSWVVGDDLLRDVVEQHQRGQLLSPVSHARVVHVVSTFESVARRILRNRPADVAVSASPTHPREPSVRHAHDLQQALDSMPWRGQGSF